MIKNTEKRNPNTMQLGKMTALETVTAMNNEDKMVTYAVEKALPARLCVGGLPSWKTAFGRV